ncbi:hypothetical protein B0H14DRAFT_2577628 [Mycena olivaceomarginata]|nr:hypothetical protein B0H14DRAFT_2577628 [Mycena olivaceomarginata]
MALEPDSDAVHKEANLWTVAQLAHGEGTLCRAFFANVGGAAAARTSSKDMPECPTDPIARLAPILMEARRHGPNPELAQTLSVEVELLQLKTWICIKDEVYRKYHILYGDPVPARKTPLDGICFSAPARKVIELV